MGVRILLSTGPIDIVSVYSPSDQVSHDLIHISLSKALLLSAVISIAIIPFRERILLQNLEKILHNGLSIATSAS